MITQDAGPPSGRIDRLRRWLFEPRVPLWQYVLLAVPLALLPSLTLSLLAWLVTSAIGLDPAVMGPPELLPDALTLFGVVVFAPLAETLLLAAMIALLSRLTTRPVWIAAVVAVIWGLLHATAGALWFFGTVWSFFVFSAGWLGWRAHSRRHAFAAAALPHALLNWLVMGLVFAAPAPG